MPIDRDAAMDKAEHSLRLLRHVMTFDRGDPEAVRTMTDLLGDHLHHARQDGIRDAAKVLDVVIAARPTRELAAVRQALRELVARNDADHRATLADRDEPVAGASPR